LKIAQIRMSDGGENDFAIGRIVGEGAPQAGAVVEKKWRIAEIGQFMPEGWNVAVALNFGLVPKRVEDRGSSARLERTRVCAAGNYRPAEFRRAGWAS